MKNKYLKEFYLLESSYQKLLPEIPLLLAEQEELDISLFHWLCYQTMHFMYGHLEQTFKIINEYELSSNSSFFEIGLRLILSCYIREALEDRVPEDLLEGSLKEITEPELIELLDKYESLFQESMNLVLTRFINLASDVLVNLTNKFHTNMLSYVANQEYSEI